MGHWWAAIRESTSRACFSPGSFVVRSLGKQNAWSPPPMGCACQVQSGALLATSAKLGPGFHPPHSSPHLFPCVGHTSSPTAHICGPAPAVHDQRRSPISFPPRPNLLPQPSWFGAGRNKASFQKHLSKPRAHSDWTCLGHRPTPGPVAVGGQVSVWTGRSEAGRGSYCCSFPATGLV